MPDITPKAIEALETAILDTLWNQDADGLFTGSAAETALAFIRDAIHRDGADADAIRETLGLDVGWAVRFERDAGPTMDNPSGVITVEQPVRSEDHARHAVKVGAPISARNRRPVRRVVGEWQEVQP